MPLLKTYLHGDLSNRDRNILNDIIAQGIRTDANLVLDPNTVVAKTNGRIQKTQIESLLDRVILPVMSYNISKPLRASDLCQKIARGAKFQLTTGWNAIDELLGSHGWVAREVSEICGSSGTGKTQLCLSTMVTMLIQDKTSHAVWIDTLDGGFSGQRTSDLIQNQLLRLNQSHINDETIKGQVLEVLSRIQVYTCSDIYDVIDAIESIRKQQLNSSSLTVTRLLVVDSISTVLTEILRANDGSGHATMIHTARELGRLAKDFDLVVLLTALTAQVAFPEEQSPSILATSYAKPSLGSSWKYASDLQIYLTKLDPTNNHRLAEFTLNGDHEKDVLDNSIGLGSNKTPAMRLIEILKAKRLKIGEWTIFDLSHH